MTTPQPDPETRATWFVRAVPTGRVVVSAEARNELRDVVAYALGRAVRLRAEIDRDAVRAILIECDVAPAEAIAIAACATVDEDEAYCVPERRQL